MRLLFLFLILTAMAPAHKFYVSMTEIEWEAEEKVMGITSRFFVDDLERALNAKGNLKIHEKNSPEVSLQIKAYYMDHFALWDK
jgi:hypothetical protein